MPPTNFDFTRIINESAVRYTFLNLTDQARRTYGNDLGLSHKDKLLVVDGAGRRIQARKHHDNQLWGNIKRWFENNKIKAGDAVRVLFDPREREDGLPVLHLDVTRDGSSASPTEVLDTSSSIAESAAEIPFGLEKQIEDFLVRNVGLLEPGLMLYVEDGREGRQYPTSIGVIDLLCQRSNGDFVVIEIKRGRASDVVVGQISRYIGWVTEHIANGSDVFGLILAADGDDALRYAVAANPKLRARYMVVKLELTDEPPR